jgi:formylglycine-generating enzyme required for sulfatase activity
MPASPIVRLLLLLVTAFAASYLFFSLVNSRPNEDKLPAASAEQDEKAPAENPPGMVWIPGGEFLMGSELDDARPDEQPAHRVRVAGFWIDETEVTNAQFEKFVAATGYVTTAERPPDLAEIMSQLPPGTPPPAPEKMVAASMVFLPTAGPVPTDDISQWWNWTPGADWRHPEGSDSNLKGREDHPVVQVSWDDAVAYAKWAHKRLPTEAEWEFAARGGLEAKHFVWGDADVSETRPQANIWQGNFPYENLATDRFTRTAPVKSFPPNNFGLYDMAGNVWEWCSDWYAVNTYARRAGPGAVDNPIGPEKSFDPLNPEAILHVQRGGSFLCNASYCASYRPSARMSSSPDTGMSHLGFRCVVPGPQSATPGATANTAAAGNAGAAARSFRPKIAHALAGDRRDEKSTKELACCR